MSLYIIQGRETKPVQQPSAVAVSTLCASSAFSASIAVLSQDQSALNVYEKLLVFQLGAGSARRGEPQQTQRAQRCAERKSKPASRPNNPVSPHSAADAGVIIRTVRANHVLILWPDPGRYISSNQSSHFVITSPVHPTQ